jgi:hypothetical protein
MILVADRRLEQSVAFRAPGLEHENEMSNNQNQFLSPLALLQEMSSSQVQ